MKESTIDKKILKAHGQEHTDAVMQGAFSIIAANPKKYKSLKIEDIATAAKLHDIGYSASEIDAKAHSAIGAELAKDTIKKSDVKDAKAVIDAIKNHHGKPETLMGAVIHDADRLASVAKPETLARRSYLYRKEQGLSPNEAARSAYHYLRRNKFNRLQSRANSAFITPEARDIFNESAKKIERDTSSYEKYVKLLKDKEVSPVYTKDTSKLSKAAGMLDYIAKVEDDGEKTKLSIRHDNNLFQDAYQAAKNLKRDDDMHTERLKVLGGTALAALGAGLMGYTAIKAGTNSALMQAVSKLPSKGVRSYATYAAPVLTGAGLYGAYQHKDDKSKLYRNIALGIAATGAALTPTMIKAMKVNTMPLEVQKEIAKYTPYAAAGYSAIIPGLLTSSHAAQKIADRDKIVAHLKSHEPYETVARRVNAIREKKNVASRYPVTRLLNTVPLADRLPNMVMGTPSSELSPEDKALYLKYQREN